MTYLSTCAGHLKIRHFEQRYCTYQFLAFTQPIHCSVIKTFKLRLEPLLTLPAKQSAYNDDPIACT